ncbi:MAG TPA: RNA-guided endonuclease IscB, partial [Mycobacterium sp.]
MTPAMVSVLDKHGKPLMPCHPARARQLLRKDRAIVAHAMPFVIRLKDRAIEDSVVDGVQVGIDPGSRHTGIAVFGFGTTTGNARRGLFSVQLDHRGWRISRKMTGRAALRRGRRTRNLRYRAPRFLNRTKPKGWLAPSLRHRVEGVMSWTTKLQRWFPITGFHQELVRFDLQHEENPEISGVEYQRGTLAGFEVREYLLAKWGRKCAYCDAPGVSPTGVPLNIDHIHPRSRGGGNRITNLTLACVPCNQRKGAQDVAVFLADDTARLARVLSQARTPLKDAAAVNSTRWVLWRELTETGLPVTTGSGGLTKFNRTTNGLAKSHTIDALCVGKVTGIAGYPAQVHVAKSTGRGSYARTRSDKYGFPKLRLTRTKQHFGFTTGDLVHAVIPRGM